MEHDGTAQNILSTLLIYFGLSLNILISILATKSSLHACFFRIFKVLKNTCPVKGYERRNFFQILLMEEILHHLGCIKPCEYWWILHINWCRISSINSIKLEKTYVVILSWISCQSVGPKEPSWENTQQVTWAFSSATKQILKETQTIKDEAFMSASLTLTSWGEPGTITGWKMNFPLGWPIFQGRTVSFREGKPYKVGPYYKWSYKPYKWPYKWVTGVFSPRNQWSYLGPYL